MSRKQLSCGVLWSVMLAASVASQGCTSSHGGGTPGSIPASIEGFEIAYALPRTVLEVQVPVTLQKGKEGKCAAFLKASMVCKDESKTVAECLGLPPFIDTASSYKLGIATLVSRAEADPNQIHTIKLTGSALTKRRVLVELSEAGILIQGESESKSKTLSLATGIIKSLAGLAAVFITEVSEDKEQCLETAKRIVAIRGDARKLQDAILGGSPIPAETAKLLLDRLEARESRLLEAFQKTEKITSTVVCEVRPVLDDVATITNGKLVAKPFRAPLLTVYSKSGVCEGDSQCAAPGDRVACWIPEALRPKDGAREGDRSTLNVTLDYVVDQYAEKLRELGISTAGAGTDRSFFYRVPALTHIALVVDSDKKDLPGSQTTLREVRPIAQLGPVGSLPGKGADLYTMALYSDSGALKKVTSLRDPVDSADITGIIDAATTVVKADQTANDELLLLERERKILEEQKKIRDLLKELEDADESDSGQD